MNMTKSVSLESLLKQHKYRITAARKQVFQVLLDHGEPMSMAELIAACNGSVDRVSVYRVVELFTELGIAHRVSLGWKYKIELTELFVGHHHHITCSSCGRVAEIDDEHEIDRYVNQLAKTAGFSPTRHVFEIEGICTDCLAPKPSSTSK